MAEVVKTSIRKGDKVVIICGKDKGKKGTVLGVNPEEGTCQVDGINVVVKHRKARGQTKSAREKKTGNIHVSNVMLLCKCGKASRIGHTQIDGKNVRVCVKCRESLDKKFVKQVKAAAAEAKDETKDTATREKKPLQRREVKATADSKMKKPEKVSSAVSLPRKIGGS